MHVARESIGRDTECGVLECRSGRIRVPIGDDDMRDCRVRMSRFDILLTCSVNVRSFGSL